ncbi:hypothetical protein M8J76_008690 [Diaphorina citri]|nr:hypothetical protein M8J75_014006 [Diaphorina citri]KAI5709034.1 hypothetical protein M8J76_008690 [Diaphorina citri]
MQLYILRRLKETALGRCLVPVSLSVVGDDVEIIFKLINLSITSSDVDDFLDFLSQTFADLGHELSKEKTFLCPLSAEYVQTYARFGLFIPKDQIMNIASEKPRVVRDPIGFLSSRKRLMLSKISRGYSEFPALL